MAGLTPDPADVDAQLAFAMEHIVEPLERGGEELQHAYQVLIADLPTPDVTAMELVRQALTKERLDGDALERVSGDWPNFLTTLTKATILRDERPELTSRLLPIVDASIAARKAVAIALAEADLQASS